MSRFLPIPEGPGGHWQGGVLGLLHGESEAELVPHDIGECIGRWGTREQGLGLGMPWLCLGSHLLRGLTGLVPEARGPRWSLSTSRHQRKGSKAMHPQTLTGPAVTPVHCRLVAPLVSTKLQPQSPARANSRYSSPHLREHGEVCGVFQLALAGNTLLPVI